MDASVEEAAWALSRRNIGGAPVKDSYGRIAGFLSRGDLVNPSWNDWVNPKKGTVGDIMTPVLLALSPDTSAMEAVDGMAAREIHHLVVVDSDHFVVGMVSSLDVVKALSRGLRFDEPPPIEVANPPPGVGARTSA
jgi:CBS domain-containing protein